MKGTDKNIGEEHLEKVDQTLELLRKNPLISTILDELHNELPKDLYYHSAAHTDDVLREAVLYALLDGRSDREIILIAIAAAYHDAGYLGSPVENERIGARLARRAMVEDGDFSETEIRAVEQMILDTRLRQTPQGYMQVVTNELSPYLLDADLANFGRHDFFEKGELLRREIGCERALFLRRTFNLIQNHSWNTPIATSLRQEQKEENLKQCAELLRVEAQDNSSAFVAGVERATFLSKLPLLLNESLVTRDIIEKALDHLKIQLGAEAATVFLLDKEANQLVFWALRGGDGERLEGLRMPSDRGIVGWVVAYNESALVNNPENDPRFFRSIDKEGEFKTRNLICAPLRVRGESPFGAIQVLNREGDGEFKEEDLYFIEQFAHQVALALDNAILHQKLQERTHALEQLEKRKNDVISVIAHEFRTPLNVIQNSADILASGLVPNEADRTKMAEMLARGVDRLAKLVTQIRNLSLVASDVVDLRVEKFDITEMARETFQEFKTAFEKRKLRSRFLGTDEALVEGDRGLLQIALRNLISNAIRFSKDGELIELELRKSSGLVQVVVRDTGIGIPSDQLPMLFGQFFEVRDAAHHSSGDLEFGSSGLGLGLATVKSILESHGTAPQVESTFGKGSTFSFSLPLL